ncbi:MAG: molybdopterin-binding protein [Anaerolineae bacterium]|nr:molybdopterin-binding protein [Anaerolineae bacterium]
MSEQARAEIIAIGNELLLGDVLDTNTNWLCKRITGIGGQVTRAALVRDEHAAIVAEIRSALDRAPDLIITTGGLGPTGDDITMQAVGEATARPIELHAQALAMVKARYQDLVKKGYLKDPTLTDARKKMACLPRGAAALRNPVGTAPAAVLKIGDSTLVSLPGVPEELKGIYEETLQPTLKRIFGDSYYEEQSIIALCGDESSLAPVLSEVVETHPEVYIKSRARRYGAEVRILITLSHAGEGREGVERSLAAALEALTRALAAAGFEVENQAPE